MAIPVKENIYKGKVEYTSLNLLKTKSVLYVCVEVFEKCVKCFQGFAYLLGVRQGKLVRKSIAF